jgi:ADP-ribose pyrophosphatase YjhB (NUDIX family)
MNEDPVSRMYVDHYLQMAILSRLSEADKPLRFSELKEDGIENSLFMYHANKLMARRAIEKDDGGYRLTANGARWVNSIGRGMMSPQVTVKPLIQLVIRDNAGNLLLSGRKGQLKGLLNDYMLPGGLHKIGKSADENAANITAKILKNSSAALRFLTVAESINTYADGFTYHSISHIYAVDVDSLTETIGDDRFEFKWVSLSEIKADNPLFASSLFVPNFVEKLQNNTLQQREVIEIAYM